ncbi:TetR/AcrR family transcriptional regulator [Saccharopolyspora indica]|uniref:TetR/AcrR family transcriptional regulator n=1 Tax=Saccharopolyspora indica TaxID=1229659 RepID=UPI0022EB4E7C|nr:TetR/AcrR family transcriptional regulator [Saccharopolyspora indica]MDA3645321.1 TetR/AcrR family transcriptional regulator [Saccharopolyspora indica]
MARTKPGEQRRSELLDAAESIVLRSGIESLTVDDVTTAAGVAKGTFYLHFGNKYELVTALRNRYVNRFVLRQRDESREGVGVDRIERWVQVGIEEYLRDVRLHDVLFHHASRPDPSASNPSVDALAELIGEAGVGAPDPHATAVVLYCAMHGVADHIVHAPDQRERMLAEVSRLCRALVGGAGG